MPDDDSAHVERARRLLREQFGHEAFRTGQEAVIVSAMAGRNLLVVMPTGSGKSLLYQLPALLEEGLTLVVSPLIALMKDQVDDLTRRGIPATFINSSLSPDEQRGRIEACQAGQFSLLYVAPERFRSPAFVAMLRRVRVARLAVDEAHCISQWGHDFRPDYRRLRQARQIMGEPRVTALTATATPRVQRDIVESLGLTIEQVDVHVHGFDRPNLELSVRHVGGDADKTEFIANFIRANRGSGIVYVGTRKAAERLTAGLAAIEPSLVLYHAGLESDQRSSAQEAFLSGKARLAVATLAFGMGVDKPDIRFVLHYHFPGSVEQYYQEIGRAGRDGKTSSCVLLYNAGDRSLREFFISLNYPDRPQVRAMMEAIFETDANPVLMTHAELAADCEGLVHQGQVTACLRLLEEGGIARGLTGEASATVHLDRPGAEILPGVRGKVQRTVFEALAEALDLESPGSYSVNLDHLARAASLTAPQVQRAMSALDVAGHIRYDPPFRGRGVEKLVQAPPPFEDVAIDWDRQDMLRGLEEEKLRAMESYIRSRSCRRGVILRYFGESGDRTCGACDCCRDAAQRAAAGGEPPDVPALHQNIAPAVLVCLKHLRFPLGISRTAEVVTGSRNSHVRQWKLDRNPAYGKVVGTRDQVKAVIAQLIAAGYVCQEGPYDRPVLALTDRGAATAEEIDPATLGAARAPRPATATATAIASARLNDPERIALAALRCVEQLDPSVGVGRVVEVLTGSKAQWIDPAGADRLDVYGITSMAQKDVQPIIHGLIGQGLLRQDLAGRYPVLQLTPAGQDRLHAGAESPDAPTTPDEQTTQAQSLCHQDGPGGTGFQPVAFSDPEPALAALIEQALRGDRERARSAVDPLRLFHPAQIVRRVRQASDQTASLRARSRAIWLLGELAGAEALELLLEAAQARQSELRRLAATALAKAASDLGRRAQESARLAPRLQEALAGLLEDPDDQVRRQARLAVTRLTGQRREAE